MMHVMMTVFGNHLLTLHRKANQLRLQFSPDDRELRTDFGNDPSQIRKPPPTDACGNHR